MSGQTPTSALEVQVEALLQRVANDQAQRCNGLRAGADSQTRELLSSARAEARANVRTAIAEERARIEQGLRQAEARADLDARRRAQREMRAELGHMWAEIGGVLETRWQDPAHRRAWIDAALAAAGILLGGRSWRIEHGAEWPQAECQELETFAHASGCQSLEWAPDTTIRAGLRIRATGVCFDATVAGLLAHHDDIESAFLADYLAEQPIHDDAQHAARE